MCSWDFDDKDFYDSAGFIIFQGMRNYAIDRIPLDTDEETKEKIIGGIDDCIYGLMMIMDSVTGFLENIMKFKNSMI